MVSDATSVGKKGESYAKAYLQSKGFIQLGQNVRSRWGEIDFVFRDRDTIRFIEVKTRIGTIKGKPYEAVGYHKIKSLHRAIETYIQKHKLQTYKWSIDVVSIILDNRLRIVELKWFENAG